MRTLEIIKDGTIRRHVRYTNSAGDCIAVGFDPTEKRGLVYGSIHPAGNLDPANVCPIAWTRSELASKLTQWRRGNVHRTRGGQ